MNEAHDIRILRLSLRIERLLFRMHMRTVEDVLYVLKQRGPDAFLSFRNFGKQSYIDVVCALSEKGFIPQFDKAPMQHEEVLPLISDVNVQVDDWEDRVQALNQLLAERRELVEQLSRIDIQIGNALAVMSKARKEG